MPPTGWLGAVCCCCCASAGIDPPHGTTSKAARPIAIRRRSAGAELFIKPLRVRRYVKVSSQIKIGYAALSDLVVSERSSKGS
jgi:hypothetical protein